MLISNGKPVGWRKVFIPLRPLALFFRAGRKAVDAIYATGAARRFAACGSNVHFDPRGIYSYASIHLGDYVNLGSRPVLLAARSRIQIGNHVMFGPEVVIRGGNHRIDVLGRFMDEIGEDEKRPEDDRGVVIEDDVWVGQRALILGGVRIGRGAVVAAGSVVTKNVPPYALVAGSPARVIRMRFSPDEILVHESMLKQRFGVQR